MKSILVLLPLIILSASLHAQTRYIGFESSVPLTGSFTNGQTTFIAQYQTTPGSVDLFLDIKAYVQAKTITGAPIKLMNAPEMQFVDSNGVVMLEKQGVIITNTDFPGSYLFVTNSSLSGVSVIRLVLQTGSEFSYGDTVTVSFKEAYSGYFGAVGANDGWIVAAYPNITNMLSSASTCPRVNVASAANGQVNVTLQGQPNLGYVLESSSDLNSWQTVTNVMMATNTASVSDLLYDRRFYRARTQY